MGTEIVFLLILPDAALCSAFAVWLWSRVAKMERGARSGPSSAYVPLLVGFAASMAGLALLTYVEGYADFTSTVQQGYYTEAQRSVYLPGRLFGQAMLQLVFVLPVISFVVSIDHIAHQKGPIVFKTCWYVCRRELVSAVNLGVVDQFRNRCSFLFASVSSYIYNDSCVALRIADTHRSDLASPVEVPSLRITDLRHAKRPQLVASGRADYASGADRPVPSMLRSPAAAGTNGSRD